MDLKESEFYERGLVCIAREGEHLTGGDNEQRPIAYLPHSCDEWVIGGAKEIQAMIEDLTLCLREIAK